MKVIFETIHIENFLSMGNVDIVLNDSGYTLINGVNNNPDDLAKSNGAGKSTIFEAISYAITGETIRGSKDVTNIYGNDGALVELTFKIDENEYRLIRTKDHSKYKTNLKIFINGEDKSAKGIRDSQKVLEELLPDLTSSLLGSVIILGQGLPQRFTNNSPSGRKEVLEKLSKSDFMLQDLKDRIGNRKTELNTALRASEDTLLKYDSTKQLLNKQIDDNKLILANLSTTDTIDELINQLESAVLDCQIKINTYNDEAEQFRTQYNEVANSKIAINENIAACYKKESSVNEQMTKVQQEENDAIAAIKTKYEPIKSGFNNDYISASTELKSKKSELIKMQNVKDTCPTCGQKLPGVFKPDTSEIEKAIESLTNSMNDAQNALNNAQIDEQSEIDAIKPVYENQITAGLNDLRAIGNEINNFKMNLNSIDTQLSGINNNINTAKNNAETYRIKGENYQSRINSAKLEKEGLENKKNAAESIIKSNEKQIEDIDTNIVEETKTKDKVNKHLEIINKMSTVITRDFRGYLLKNIIDFINKKSKEYALDVFETDKINFELDGNNIAITYDSKDYSNLSGGEKQKVDLIVQFAIRDMLCKYLNFSSNILVLDEITDNVDSIGAEKLFNMISRKLSDVQSIFIITHHASDLQIPCDRQLTIIKDSSKISRVEYTI